jgi:hypothetical protein
MIKICPRRLSLGVAAASLAAVSVAACGGGSAGGSSATATGGAPSQPTAAATAAASAVHACALLTAAQASSIVGVHYSSATEASAGSMCSYATTTAPIPLFIIISPGSGATAWQDQLATLKEDSGSALVPLAGVGDRAEGSGTEIGVQDGNYIIDVHGGDPLGTGSAFPKSIALAKAIIAGLH